MGLRGWRRAGKACGVMVLAMCPGIAPALDSINFQYVGDVSEELRDILRAVSTLSEIESREEQPPQDVMAAAQGDYTRLVEALYAQGYYGPNVRIRIDGREAATIPPFETPDRISHIDVIVEPGKRFVFGDAVVAPVAPGTPETEQFDSGERARASAVRNRTQDVITGWRQVGNATARVQDQSITARHEAGILDVIVRIDPGRQYRFGEVIVTSDSAVKDARIRQIAGIPRGGVFDPDEVDKGAERLRTVGTFRSVTLEERPGPGNELDILIDVTDRKPRRFGFGAELSSNEGLKLTSFWLHRNIFGGAERFRIDGEVRQLAGQDVKPDYEISARFEKPAVYGPDTLFFATASVSYEEEPDYISRQAGFGIGVSQEFSDTLTGEIGLTLSRSEITDLYLPGEPERTLDVLALPVSLTWDKRDDQLDARNGFFLRSAVEPFTILSGDDAGAKYDFDARYYKAFMEDDAVVAAARLQLGGLFGPEAADAPPDYLYYSGGGGTVRGQPFESLNALYSDGTRLGGRSFVGLSGEVRVDVTGKLGIVAFADAGYIGPESFYDGSGDWHSGAGIGARYKTPVGPIRFDIAGPVSGDTGDGVQLYIGIGQAF
ncbi:autotransporter assembly complex family protein [Sagittula sp. MA-2]|uniref:autotransporter assembly complex protein TamA n=1 Tax=Sagittula sp. MA-2 TaxID=3048007 RepID=UPI0024C401D7|nr:autotransporter assembly complex family protein [Sagittula sp. MA-2]WHZ36695.1 autotransporter assembly complex family protein [Sagittula sp. MA-2]